MNPFEYLSVLVSIIIGLAITHLLSSTARLIQQRRRVRPHAASLCWMATLFLLNIQVWWAAFDRRDSTEWDFFAFLLYLAIPILVFLLSYLVLPDLDAREDIDLRANFEGNRGWFFGLLAVLPAVSLLETWIRDDAMPSGGDAVFRIAFLVAALVAGRIGSARFQLWNAAGVLAALCLYIGMLFLQLR